MDDSMLLSLALRLLECVLRSLALGDVAEDTPGGHWLPPSNRQLTFPSTGTNFPSLATKTASTLLTVSPDITLWKVSLQWDIVSGWIMSHSVRLATSFSLYPSMFRHVLFT